MDNDHESSGSDSSFEFSEPAECMNLDSCSNDSGTEPALEDQPDASPETASSSSSDERDADSAMEVWDDESESSSS